ncbi:hypothetical protein GCM10017786_53540 [Amycolatopsis deserti]|uniref:Uncharacterized protein n=1 Tax=Amycolatopsis deserti TaxID=185696 RepID=A0ABQ3JFM5_9PSEU|nr:hypothetical protein GCM10017786_53540 [Amycolatopsis deserti]
MIATAATPTAAQIAYATPTGIPRFSTLASAANATRYPATTTTEGHSFVKPSDNFIETVAVTSAAMARASKM